MNLPNCVPQEIYKPDTLDEGYLEDETCPHCDKATVYEETELFDDGFIEKKYWCDWCEGYIEIKEEK